MDITLIGSKINLGYNIYALVIDGICQVTDYINSVDKKIIHK
jgi:hypothetical protein